MTADVHNSPAALRLQRSLRAGVEGEWALPLVGWELARLPKDAARSAAELAAADAAFRPARVPGTVGQLEAGAAETIALDDLDHVYRVRFARPDPQRGAVRLQLDGLATLADVWLNGSLVGSSANMFEAHAFDVSSALQRDNELYIRFAALAPVLREKRPRGRWPTRLVSEKNLRFVRTTLLGYMPGFTPPRRPVGPWRDVRLVVERELAVEHVWLHARLEDERGVLDAAITCALAGAEATDAELRVGGTAGPLAVERLGAGRFRLRGRLVVDGAQPWWPHTHGIPQLYPATLDVALGGGATARIDLGRIGFRALSTAADGFAVRINGCELFCRGACWTPLDADALHVDEASYRSALQQVRDAGMNMLRLSGNFVYESDAFYRLCDELGILVWQDFMFASMDYPVDDPEFMASCRREAAQFLERTAGRPCIAVLCGNSEVAQQSAMMGMAPELWSNELFDRVLPELCACERPDARYVPSSPSGGGAMPFHTGPGPTHYYGVGAYLRPIDDARLRPVRFASECLAFSIPPSDQSLHAFLGGEPAVAHHPRYKQRVPRDPGAGWDFADVTDHYLELVFGVQARAVRYEDPERHLELSRVAAGEVMARVQGLWRGAGSGCHGALVWLLRDLWEGAGFGLIDSSGLPKAPYYFLRRVWAPLALWFVDEGTDGLWLHAANDGSAAVDARIELALYAHSGRVVEQAQSPCELPPRGQRAFSVEGLIGRFVDSSRAYRFGPPAHALVAARLVSAREPAGGGGPLARAFHRALGVADRRADVGLSAVAAPLDAGAYLLRVSAQRSARAVSVHAPGFVPGDDYFDLAPGETHALVLAPLRPGAAPHGTVRALDADRPSAIRLEPEAPPARTP